MDGVNQIDVFDYGDYRQFLRDAFGQIKEQRRGFSLTVLGRATGQSKVAVKWVLDAKRHIANEKIGIWADALGLQAERRTYFRHLVGFAKAKSHDERTEHYNAMARLKQAPLPSRVVDADSAGLWRDWYLPAIAELSYCRGFRKEPRWIKAHLAFPVSLRRIEEALRYLERAGYLAGTAGVATKTKTPDEFRSHIYKSYTIKQAQLAGEAIAQQRAEDREVFTLTVSIPAEKMALAKARIAQVRHELHDLLAGTDPADQVVQINMSMFTLGRGER